MVIQRSVSLGSHIETHSPCGSKVISCTLSGVHTVSMSTKNKLQNLKVKEGSAEVSQRKLRLSRFSSHPTPSLFNFRLRRDAKRIFIYCHVSFIWKWHTHNPAQLFFCNAEVKVSEFKVQLIRKKCVASRINKYAINRFINWDVFLYYDFIWMNLVVYSEYWKQPYRNKYGKGFCDF